MTKEQKYQLVTELKETLKEYPNFYIADTGGLTVEHVNNLRRKCHEAGIRMQVVKNTLIRKALDELDGDFSGMYDTLNLPSAVFFATEENPSVPARVIDEFRKEDDDKPILKVACIGTDIFIGNDQIKTLKSIKSKNELIGDLVGLLQSPMRNLTSALGSGASNIHGLLKALAERE